MKKEDKEKLNYILKTTISKPNHKQELYEQMEQYELYKNNFVKDLFFDPSKIDLSMFICLLIPFLFSFMMTGRCLL